MSALTRMGRRGAAAYRAANAGGAPFQGDLIFAALPGVEQSFSGSPSRFTEWRDTYGGAAKLVPVTGATAGQSVDAGGRVGLAIGAAGANCMKLAGAASATWPAMAAPSAAAGPHGVTAYLLARFAAIGTTAPLSMGASAQANFVYAIMNTPTANRIATRQVSVGTTGAVSANNVPTGSLVVTGFRWGDPSASTGTAADPMAVKLGSETWKDSDSNRAAQTAAVLDATVGGYGLQTTAPSFPANADVFAVLFYKGAHNDADAETVRAFLESL